jgi:SPW repeat
MIRQLIRTQREDPLPAAVSTLVAVALAAPWLLDFNASHPAVANHIAFAMAFGPLALMVTALRAAAATCIAGGAWLTASPWVLGYASTGLAGWLADLLIGAALVLLSFEALSGRALQRRALRPSARIAAAARAPAVDASQP